MMKFQKLHVIINLVVLIGLLLVKKIMVKDHRVSMPQWSHVSTGFVSGDQHRRTEVRETLPLGEQIFQGFEPGVRGTGDTFWSASHSQAPPPL